MDSLRYHRAEVAGTRGAQGRAHHSHHVPKALHRGGRPQHPQLPPLTRTERAARARILIGSHFNPKQRTFLEFVLAQYVKVGVEELDREKLSPLLKLRYDNAIADAVADLGRPEEIGIFFAGFQKYLYQPTA